VHSECPGSQHCDSVLHAHRVLLPPYITAVLELQNGVSCQLTWLTPPSLFHLKASKYRLWFAGACCL